MSAGMIARIKISLDQRADFTEVLAGSWSTLAPGDLAHRTVELERDGRVAAGDLFDFTGTPGGQIRLTGDLEQLDRLGAGLSEGQVIVEGNVGRESGVGMSGGSLDIQGNAGPRAGGALPAYKRGMSGGELIVRGSAGDEAGASMRRGLLVIGRAAGARAGLGMIAGNIIVFGAAGTDTGLWSKRGSVVALGGIAPPATYSYACTYQPVHLRLMFMRLQVLYGLRVQKRYLNGLFRRYSGDLAELGKGEILEWTST
jgi:formylmethanofuran dehydrogenase subunit C